MNWYKAKTILIVFLMFVNVSLFTYLCYDRNQVKVREERVIDTVITLLKDKNITVDKEIVMGLRKHKNAKTAYAENIISDYREFSEIILGENAVKTAENTYSSAVGTVSFDSNRFSAFATGDDVLKEYKTDKDTLKENVIDYLELLGVNAKTAEIILSGNEKEYSAVVSKQINGRNVFKTGITLVFSQKGLVSARGTWYEQTENDGSVYELKGISSILTDYMNSASVGSKINSISLGYSVPDEDVFYKNVSFVPVWEIKDDMNNVIYIDARKNVKN